MRKRFCLLPALALALLCACSKGAAKTPPTRPADFTSTERQFNTPADGDTIAIFDTSLGEVRAVLYPDAAPMAVYNFVGLAAAVITIIRRSGAASTALPCRAAMPPAQAQAVRRSGATTRIRRRRARI